jgi:PQQ-dependent dehydrogenase (s-GDH family)
VAERRLRVHPQAAGHGSVRLGLDVLAPALLVPRVVAPARRRAFGAVVAGLSLALAALPGSGAGQTGDGAGDQFTFRVLATGLAAPWEIAWGPDDHLWVTEREGKRITRVHPATGAKTVAVTIPEAYTNGGQVGVLGMALHPSLLRQTGEDFVYVAFTYATAPAPALRLRAAIRRYTYDTATQRLHSPRDILPGLPGNGDHNGGRLAIGPDGMLYYTIGDQGANQSWNKCVPNRAMDLPTAAEVRASDWSAYQGKTLRMTLDGGIPADNPVLRRVRSHVFSYGHRNAQGLVFGPGGRLYSSEHGPKTDDEINLIQAGKNYGWPYVAGYIDDKAYTYDDWSASGPTPCERLTWSDVHVPPSVPRYPESAFDHPDFVPPMKTFGTVDSDYKFERPGCAGFACYPSIAPSSIDVYPARPDAPAPIAHWATSLLVPSLKRGSVFRLKLGEDGTSIVGPEIELWQTRNRYRDLAINPDGRTFYVATDHAGANPGSILEFRYRDAR